MKAALLRTGSISVHPQVLPSSPSLSRHDSISCELFSYSSPKLSLHSDSNPPRRDISARGIRRVSSESDVIASEADLSPSLSRLRSRSFSTIIPEEYVTEGDLDDGRSSVLLSNLLDDAAIWHGNAVSVEDVEASGGGYGKGRKAGGGDYGSGGFAGGNGDRSKIGDYYQQMLKSNPGDSLLLRNYAKYLHEVEADLVRAEEYYGRAILANPRDGELLALYGNLIWEKHRDEDRAKAYFDQAVHASPDDCTVLGSYARFMWEADEDEEEEDYMSSKSEVSLAMVAGV